MNTQQNENILCEDTDNADVMEDSNAENINNDFESIFKDIFFELETKIPSEPVVEVKNEKSTENKIEDYNKEIISTYLKGEEGHLKGQKPVAIIIAIAVGLQLIAFNVLIFMITLRNYEIDKMQLLLDFMKYYTGAVIVEMLGLCFIIVKGVFSVSLGKMVEHILKKKK